MSLANYRIKDNWLINLSNFYKTVKKFLKFLFHFSRMIRWVSMQRIIAPKRRLRDANYDCRIITTSVRLWTELSISYRSRVKKFSNIEVQNGGLGTPPTTDVCKITFVHRNITYTLHT